MSGAHFQLFKILPSVDFINKICELYGIKNLDINYNFTIDSLKKFNTVEKLNNIKDDICAYYINCKCIKYMEDLTEKKSITILRHFLRVINYKVISREKYSEGKKYLQYNLKNLNNNNDYDLTINFD